MLELIGIGTIVYVAIRYGIPIIFALLKAFAYVTIFLILLFIIL
jgi:hypothetical protein